LSLAAAWGHESTVLQLLESGAELYAKGEYGQTALERAREGGHKATVVSGRMERISKDLILTS
jgi:ankyrin repeat protein